MGRQSNCSAIAMTSRKEDQPVLEVFYCSLSAPTDGLTVDEQTVQAEEAGVQRYNTADMTTQSL